MELKKCAINETWKLYSLVGFLGLFLIAAILTNNPQTIDIPYLRTTLASFITSQQHQQPPTSHREIPTNKTTNPKRKCKMYEGRWVYKPQENPMYRFNQCPFLEEKMSCQKNGRPDSLYEGWSWESNSCPIPLYVIISYRIKYHIY